MKAGQIVTTGSLHKPIPIERPARIRADVEGVGEVALDIVRGR
jgi:2-keto-4-pentenoate hydratase